MLRLFRPLCSFVAHVYLRSILSDLQFFFANVCVCVTTPYPNGITPTYLFIKGSRRILCYDRVIFPKLPANNKVPIHRSKIWRADWKLFWWIGVKSLQDLTLLGKHFGSLKLYDDLISKIFYITFHITWQPKWNTVNNLPAFFK